MKKYFSSKLSLVLVAAVQLLPVSSIRASTNCVTSPLGLVSWWRAEGDATDATGLNPGVFINAVTFTNGEVGQAFGLSAPSNYVRVPASASLDVGQSGGFTVEGWINPTDQATHPIVDWSQSGAYGAVFWTDGSGGFYGNIVDTNGNYHVVQTAEGLIALNVFQHFALTYDKASGIARVFLNGSGVLQVSLGTFTPKTGSDLYIGYRLPTVPFGGNTFQGQIDELSLYSRALATNEIQAIYAASGAGKCPTNVPPSTNCVAAASGLISWWKAEGNADDAVDANSGVLVNGTTFAGGEVGQAFNFNGADQLVVVSNSPSLNPTSGLTLESWINVSDFSAIDVVAIADKDDPYAPVRQYQLGMGNTGSNWVFRAHVGLPSGYMYFGGTTAIQTGVWYHVAMTYDQSALKLFVNGNLDRSMPVTGAVVTTTLPFLIGGHAEGPWNFKGRVDELALYDRALSTNEIQAIYNAGSGGKCVAPAAPSIVFQPQSQTVLAGSNVTLTVAAQGSPIVTYQWQFNGTNLAGATGYSLTLTNIQLTNTGNYSVAITNSIGWTISSNATLSVKAVFAYGNNQQFTNSQYTFNGQVTIRLQNGYPNGLTFYTLDGSTPTFSSQQYSTPFVLNHDAILRAVGYSPDFLQSGESDPVSVLIVPYYTLTATTAGGGSIVLNPSGGTYLSNTVVTLTATPSSGWTFLQWLGDVPATNTSTNLTMARNISMRAVFGTTLSTTAAGGGSVALNPSGGLYPYGTGVQITAIPQPGNYFGIWGNAASGNTNPLSFVVRTANPTVSSLFGALSSGQVALTVVPVGNGRVAVSPRTNVYNVGAAVSITATPDSGQSFGGWSGDTNGTHNPLSLTMDQSKVIYANFTTRPSLSVQSSFEGLKPEGFHMTLSGLFGAQYEIDASSDLINWTPLATLTNPYGSVELTDPAATNLARRFYRAVVMP